MECESVAILWIGVHHGSEHLGRILGAEVGTEDDGEKMIWSRICPPP